MIENVVMLIVFVAAIFHAYSEKRNRVADAIVTLFAAAFACYASGLLFLTLIAWAYGPNGIL